MPCNPPPPTVLCVLQNAWSPEYAGRRWPRAGWLRALHASRSGQRLAVFAAACGGAAIEYVNTTPAVGATPDSILPPDPRYVRAAIRLRRPAVVVAFGGQAAATVRRVWGGAVLFLPHPTYRCLTNALLTDAGRLVAAGVTGWHEFRQGRGGHTVTSAAPRLAV